MCLLHCIWDTYLRKRLGAYKDNHSKVLIHVVDCEFYAVRRYLFHILSIYVGLEKWSGCKDDELRSVSSQQMLWMKFWIELKIYFFVCDLTLEFQL